MKTCLEVSLSTFALLSNIERIKQEATWSEDMERWRVPDIVFPRTKLPPASEFSLRSRVQRQSPHLLNAAGRDKPLGWQFRWTTRSCATRWTP